METEILREKSPEEKGGPSAGRRQEKHGIHIELTNRNIAEVIFDNPDKAANIFDEATLDQLDIALNAVERIEPDAVVFRSAKPKVFIAGADLDSLASANEELLEHLIVKGQQVFQRIAALPMPTVAAIHGACLGGGLELALACDARIASDDKVTKIGLPETLLGIIPAWGGSTRLPRLIGLPKALAAILSGKAYAAKHAKSVGIVDRVVPRERLNAAAVKMAGGPAVSRKSFFLTNNPLSSAVIRGFARRNLLRKTRGNYPAQEAAIAVAGRGGNGPVDRSLKREREAVMKLARSGEARNLMRLFRLQERSKKFRYDPKVNRDALPPVTRTAVIGAGVMGSGIAQWFAARGASVILRDIDRGKVAAGMESVRKLFSGAVRKRILTKHEAMRKMDLITPSAEAVPLSRCDLVVEAAVENLEIKKKIFADLCARASDETILATNTSALPISELCEADGVTHPERIIGLHFFNPVSRMKLVEVVVTEWTSPEVVERVLSFVRGIGKLPVVVKDSPGFLVNRILMPYLIEAGKLVDKGYTPAYIDKAMLDFGMPMGPLRLLDEVGLDVASHVAATMGESFGARFALPVCIKGHLASGNLGKKSGRGFYPYEKGEPVVVMKPDLPPVALSRSAIAEQLAGLMSREAALCLDEGIALDADDIDFAMVMGTGFAPFRGGPLEYARGRKTLKLERNL
ncbi:MAG: 3-hydroxyacyl-CoA dehydrogenase NAD-binding domain-containing protein [Verrucomicrobiales bacterium]|nr:3-hydroxyacyl-CoA dehydrogenase NAD-binding domain-containing protein [Verrucomicrobiales bacterium]